MRDMLAVACGFSSLKWYNIFNMLKCAMTVVIDGSNFFDIWCRYYSRYFDNKDIYILDLGKGKATQNIPFKVIPITFKDLSNLHAMNALVNDYKASLLKQYKWILFSDNDEIIYHPNGLDNYMDNLETDYVTCNGFDVVQSLRTEYVRRGYNGLNLVKEPSIDWNKPILPQRKFWQANTAYRKTLITSVDFKWSTGMHVCCKPQKIDHALKLMHLKKIDYDYCEQLNQRYRKVGTMHSPLNSRPVGDKFRTWWMGTSQRLVPIPEEIRESLAF